MYRGSADMRRFESLERAVAEVRDELGSLFELVLQHLRRIEKLEGKRGGGRRSGRRRRKSSR